MLEKLLIISPLSPSEYFFPAVLNTTAESEVHKILDCHKVKGIAPLAVQFPTSWAPPGVYCCSVYHLQSLSHWEVVHKSPTSTSSSKDILQLPHFSRNSVTFTKRGRPGSVTFIDNFAFFIVCLNVDTRKIKQEGLLKLCQAVRTELFAAVEAGLENTHHSSFQPELAFLCPCQVDCCSCDLHTAHLSEDCTLWICSENHDEYGSLNPDQTLWLDKSSCLFSLPYYKSSMHSYKGYSLNIGQSCNIISRELCQEAHVLCGFCLQYNILTRYGEILKVTVGF